MISPASAGARSRSIAVASRRLAAQVDGMIALPGDPEYAIANDIFNTTVVNRPDLILVARSEQDIQVSVRFAAEHSLPVYVQATGHGPSVAAEGGLLVSTRELRAIEISQESRTARVAAGVRAGELVDRAAEIGLAPIIGSSPTVGVVGYTLGGGLSVIGRSFGYAADHVRELRVVTATGEVVTASPTQNPDLFWATRGARDNFGIVTSLTTDLFPVTRLYGGGIYFSGQYARQLLNTYSQWTTSVPDEMTSSIALVRLPPSKQIPEPIRGEFLVHLRIAYTGTTEDGERLVSPLRATVPALIDSVQEMPFTDIGAISQDPTSPGSYIDRSASMHSLTPEAIDALLMAAGPGVSTPLSVVELRHLGGALARIPARSSAVGHRSAAFSLFASGRAAADGTHSVQTASALLFAQLEPWTNGEPLGCFLSTSDTDPTMIAAAFEAADYRRLTQIKADYDPTNIFRINHNIAPEKQEHSV